MVYIYTHTHTHLYAFAYTRTRSHTTHERRMNKFLLFIKLTVYFVDFKLRILKKKNTELIKYCVICAFVCDVCVSAYMCVCVCLTVCAYLIVLVYVVQTYIPSKLGEALALFLAFCLCFALFLPFNSHKIHAHTHST